MAPQSVAFREPLVDLTAWSGEYLDLSQSKVDRWLFSALQAFQTFAGLYQGYFDELISQDKIDLKRTTAVRLREQVEDALEIYRTPLERVAIQRQVAGYREELDTATDYTGQYLSQLGLSGEALIYFDKVALIQQLPYTRIPIIGIPYRLIPQPGKASQEGDWMAIPHELGHYVYWHLPESIAVGQQTIKDNVSTAVKEALSRQSLEAILAQSLEAIIIGWTEELFADVIGTYLGGEPFADSLMLLIRRSFGNSDELKVSDGTHPHSCLRPITRLRTLKHRGVSTVQKEAEWDSFFNTTFGVIRLGHLKLRANPPTLITNPEKLSKFEMLALLSGQSTVSFSVAQIRPALEAAVDSLCQTADALLATGLQIQSVDPAAAFQQLLAQSQRANSKGAIDFQVLLNPQTLQGGDAHKHSAWVLDGHYWWTLHDCGEHKH